MRVVEYVFYGIATLLFGWFSLNIFFGKNWTERSKKTFSVLLTVGVFIGFAVYRLITGTDATDKIQEILFCPFYKFPYCPHSPAKASSQSTVGAQPVAPTVDLGASAPTAKDDSNVNVRRSYITLTDKNAKDIWSTSVYSYAPGGGGPGGGLEDEHLRVGGWADQYVSLIQFDLPKAPCTSKLELQLYNGSSDGSPTAMYLKRITEPWSWKHGDRLWWKDLPASVQVAGRVVPAPRQNSWIAIDISELFALWCTKQMPNYGLMLAPVQTNNNFNNFYSTRYVGTPDYAPRLAVNK